MDRPRITLNLDCLTSVYDNAEWQVKLVFRSLTREQKVLLPEWFKVARQVANERLASEQITEYRAGLEAERLKPQRKTVETAMTVEDLL